MKDWNRDDPLARMEGETSKANNALRNYALMGAGRSLRKLHRSFIEESSKDAPTQNLRTLLGWSSRYDWQVRVARFDEIEFEQERQDRREKRRKLIDGFFAKTAQALKAFDVNEANLGQLTQAVRMVVQESRAEYDELPIQRQEITGRDGEPIELDVKDARAELARRLNSIAKRQEEAGHIIDDQST